METILVFGEAHYNTLYVTFGLHTLCRSPVQMTAKPYTLVVEDYCYAHPLHKILYY
jgi:hypothetical protein